MYVFISFLDISYLLITGNTVLHPMSIHGEVLSQVVNQTTFVSSRICSHQYPLDVQYATGTAIDGTLLVCSFNTKKGHGLLSCKLAQNRLICNISVVLSKISLMRHFSCSVFVKKYNFHIRTLKNWKIWIFETHHAIKHVRGQWISKIYVSQYF